MTDGTCFSLTVASQQFPTVSRFHNMNILCFKSFKRIFVKQQLFKPSCSEDAPAENLISEETPFKFIFRLIEVTYNNSVF